jgi:hypothetical protein
MSVDAKSNNNFMDNIMVERRKERLDNTTSTEHPCLCQKIPHRFDRSICQQKNGEKEGVLRSRTTEGMTHPIPLDRTSPLIFSALVPRVRDRLRRDLVVGGRWKPWTVVRSLLLH